MTTLTLALIFMGAVLACLASANVSAPHQSAEIAALGYSVRLVQVVHRHGARSPIVSYNTTQICGTEYPCGYLNTQGQQMLVNFGSYLRNRYNSDSAVVSTPFFSLESYNVSVSYTRSTDVLRTLQSASALLSGLFPNASAFFPAIHTVDNNFDALLHSSVVPAILSRYYYANEELTTLCNAVLDSRVSYSQVQAVAAEVYSSGFCSVYEERWTCADKLCDIALAYQSTGQLTSYPLLSTHMEDLCAVTATSADYYFGYNASNPVHQKQGTVYQHLAKELLANMKLHQSSKNAPSYKFYEYSAHDTTVAPLSVVFGDHSLKAMMPPFGAAYILELLTPTSSSASSSWYVRLLRGHPGVTPSSNYTFALDSFSMRCMNAMNTTYIASENICPYEDFERFINSTGPTSEEGVCYIDPQHLARMNCSSDAEADGRALSKHCLLYRQLCAKFACGTGYRVDASDYSCYRINASATTTSRAKEVGLRVILFICGVTLGAAVMFAWRRYRKTVDEQRERLEVVVE